MPIPPRLAAVATTCGRFPVALGAGAQVQFRQVGGGGGGGETDGDPEITRATMSPARLGKKMNRQGAGHIHEERRHQHPSTARPVGDVPGEEETGDHADGIHGIDDRHHDVGKVIPGLVEHIEGCRHRREGHVQEKGGRHHPERQPWGVDHARRWATGGGLAVWSLLTL